MKVDVRLWGWRVLRLVRCLVALAALAAMVLLLTAPNSLGFLAWLARLQLVPAVLALSALELGLLAIVALMFGRLYCSVVCPLGIAQDLAHGLLGWPFRRRQAAAVSRRRQWVRRGVRLAVLGVFLAGFGFGFAQLLEPYGIFSRSVTAGAMGVGEPELAVRLGAVGVVSAILALAVWRSRWWCNRICPVGTVLGLFGRWSWFRVRIDAERCNGCGTCVRACAAGAIRRGEDGKVTVDNTECVVCLKCGGKCPSRALTCR